MQTLYDRPDVLDVRRSCLLALEAGVDPPVKRTDGESSLACQINTSCHRLATNATCTVCLSADRGDEICQTMHLNGSKTSIKRI